MKMFVCLEWNDELGEHWLNEENLKLLLYGQAYSKPELLSFTAFKPIEYNDEEVTFLD
jgi:hypothetical protein